MTRPAQPSAICGHDRGGSWRFGLFENRNPIFSRPFWNCAGRCSRPGGPRRKSPLCQRNACRRGPDHAELENPTAARLAHLYNLNLALRAVVYDFQATRAVLDTHTEAIFKKSFELERSHLMRSIL